jgi:hypothetical protein
MRSVAGLKDFIPGEVAHWSRVVHEPALPGGVR